MKFASRYRVFGFLLLACISSTYFFSRQVFGEGTYANLGTTNSQDGSSDALTWDQGNALTIDTFGKYITLIQNRSGVSNFTWSNDSGATWTQSAENNSFLTRGSVAYDSINDKLHVIWLAASNSDGIIYRRYGITRDGSNNITAIAREDAVNVNLQLDVSSACNFEHPSAIWKDDGSADGILIAVWNKHSCSGLAEVRGSMRRLSLSAADGVAGNWVALDGTADTFSSEAPYVAADKIHAGAQGGVSNSIIIRGGTGARKDDLYVFVNEYNSGGTDEVLAYRGIWNGGASDWSTGWQSPVAVGLASTASGYSLKFQLLSKAVLDATNDRLYISWARWKTGGDGDTVSFAYLDSADTPSATVDVYASLGTHSYAPTMGLAYDATLSQLIVAYIESTTNGDNGSINYKTYDGTTLSDPIRYYTSPGGAAGANGAADIPVLYPQRVSDKLLFMFRVNGALPPTALEPHNVLFGTEVRPTPTPTPSPTPTPTSTPTQSTSSSSSSQTPGQYTPPGCSALLPGAAPWISKIDRTGSEAKLWIVPGGDPYTGIIIWYGENESTNSHADTFDQSHSSGMIVRTINQLKLKQGYSFRIQSKNDCSYSESSATFTIGKRNGTTLIGGKLINIVRQISNVTTM